MKTWQFWKVLYLLPSKPPRSLTVAIQSLLTQLTHSCDSIPLSSGFSHPSRNPNLFFSKKPSFQCSIFLVSGPSYSNHNGTLHFRRHCSNFSFSSQTWLIVLLQKTYISLLLSVTINLGSLKLTLSLKWSRRRVFSVGRTRKFRNFHETSWKD